MIIFSWRIFIGHAGNEKIFRLLICVLSLSFATGLHRSKLITQLRISEYIYNKIYDYNSIELHGESSIFERSDLTFVECNSCDTVHIFIKTLQLNFLITKDSICSASFGFYTWFCLFQVVIRLINNACNQKEYETKDDFFPFSFQTSENSDIALCKGLFHCSPDTE